MVIKRKFRRKHYWLISYIHDDNTCTVSYAHCVVSSWRNKLDMHNVLESLQQLNDAENIVITFIKELSKAEALLSNDTYIDFTNSKLEVNTKYDKAKNDFVIEQDKNSCSN